MPTAELELETETSRGSGSRIPCDAYDGGDPVTGACQIAASFWLEIHIDGKITAVCARHADEWKRFADQAGYNPAEWSLYPMG